MLHYVPAGAEAYSLSTMQVMVRNKPNDVERTHFGPKFKQWDTKERTVVEMATSVKGSKLPLEDFDVAMSIFSSTFVRECGFKIVLANPVVGKGFVRGPYARMGIKAIVDSGGFQMLKGTTDFVHPDEVVARYNANADIGMPLDLPLFSQFEPLYFNAVSHLIRANDEYLIKHCRPDIDIALISHGSTLARRKARLDVLDRPANVVAIAGLATQPPPGIDKYVNAVENFMYVTSRYRKKTEYFHVLGVTSKFWMFLYALLDRANYVKNIGADSVSHRLGALVGRYDLADFRFIDLTKNQSYKTTPKCNCPLCFAVDDLRVMHSWRLLEAHNLWVRAAQTKFLEDLAEGYLKGTIPLKEIHKALDLSMTFNKFAMLVRYVQEVMANKFRPARHTAKTRSLFGITEKLPKADPHYEQVISRYESFHSKKFPR